MATALDPRAQRGRRAAAAARGRLRRRRRLRIADDWALSRPSSCSGPSTGSWLGAIIGAMARLRARRRPRPARPCARSTGRALRSRALGRAGHRRRVRRRGRCRRRRCRLVAALPRRPTGHRHPDLRVRRARPPPARLPRRPVAPRRRCSARSAAAPAWRPARRPPSSLPRLVDTSVAIDGRVLDVVRAGFLHGRFLVPQPVIDELQGLADSGDDLRRAKGRRGLDVLEALRREHGVEMSRVAGRRPCRRPRGRRQAHPDVHRPQRAPCSPSTPTSPRRPPSPGSGCSTCTHSRWRCARRGRAGDEVDRPAAQGRQGGRARPSATSTTARWSSSSTPRDRVGRR